MQNTRLLQNATLRLIDWGFFFQNDFKFLKCKRLQRYNVTTTIMTCGAEMR